MQFTRTKDRPKVSGRTGEPNPFAEVVADLVKNGAPDDNVQVTLTKAEAGEPKAQTVKRNGKAVTTTVFPGVERRRRQLREAGTPHGVTVRSHAVRDEKTGRVTITFWTTAKQKSKTTAAPAAAAETAGGPGETATE